MKRDHYTTNSILPENVSADQVSAARHTVVVSKIPGDPGTKTMIYQSNRVTNASYDYTLIQERIKNWVIFSLQQYIKRVMNGQQVMQLDIFQDSSHYINIIVPMRAIATPAQYQDVKDAAKDMVSKVITMRSRDIFNRETVEFTGMFTSVIMTEERSGTITVVVRKDVAEMLISVDRSDAGKPKNYTGFLLEVCLKAKNKYTARIYQFISSWKERGGVQIPLQELRDRLQLGDKYQDYNLFKRRILIPVQEELKKNADCWYNVADIEEVKEGKKVTALRFKIIEVSMEEKRKNLLHNLYNVYMGRLGLTQTHIDLLSPIIERSDINDVMAKVTELYLIIQERARDIPHKGAYCYAALVNAFG